MNKYKLLFFLIFIIQTIYAQRTNVMGNDSIRKQQLVSDKLNAVERLRGGGINMTAWRDSILKRTDISNNEKSKLLVKTTKQLIASSNSSATFKNAIDNLNAAIELTPKWADPYYYLATVEEAYDKLNAINNTSTYDTRHLKNCIIHYGKYILYTTKNDKLDILSKISKLEKIVYAIEHKEEIIQQMILYSSSNGFTYSGDRGYGGFWYNRFVYNNGVLQAEIVSACANKVPPSYVQVTFNGRFIFFSYIAYGYVCEYRGPINCVVMGELVNTSPIEFEMNYIQYNTDVASDPRIYHPNVKIGK